MPLPGEPVNDKPGKGSFCATDFELMLRLRGIANPRADRHDHRCVRAHDDARGQRPEVRMSFVARLLRSNHEHAIRMINMQGGVFGTATDSKTLLEVLE
jgi:hypothetical protein